MYLSLSTDKFESISKNLSIFPQNRLIIITNNQKCYKIIKNHADPIFYNVPQLKQLNDPVLVKAKLFQKKTAFLCHSFF